MKTWAYLIWTCLALALLGSAPAAAQTYQAIDKPSLPENKKTKSGLYLSAPEAFEMKTAAPDKTLFVDIRTRGEFMFLGSATSVDANIPYVEMDDPPEWDEKNNRYKLSPNSDFAAAISERMQEKGLGKADKIILICRSGDRSALAANCCSRRVFKRSIPLSTGSKAILAKPAGAMSTAGKTPVCPGPIKWINAKPISGNEATLMRSIAPLFALLFFIVGLTSAHAGDKVLYHIDDAKEQATRALRNIRNHLDTAPDTKIIVVTHGDGVDFLLDGAKDEKNNLSYGPLIADLKARGVTFEVCEITMKRRNMTKDMFVLEADFVPSGVVRVAQLQYQQHFAYIKP